MEPMSIARTAARDLTRLFNPRAVAVVGASQDLDSISGQPIKHLKNHGYSGTIYPVNPKYQEVGGYKCYPDIASLPEIPDVVVIAVAARRVPEVMREIGEKGSSFAIVLTSGFAESDEQGKRAQQELVELANAYKIGVIGPNCQGIMNIADRVHIGFGAPYGLAYRKGAVSLTSQSGAFGNSVVMLADAEGLGFRHYVSTGNEAVISSLDLFEYFLADEGTKIIAGYVEGFKDAQRVVDLGQRALRAGKPIFIWKVGNSEVGAKAAASHTANLGGSPALYRAAFGQAGIIEVSDVGDLVDCAKALLPGRLPKGNRIAILSISGGAGILMADRCIEAGLALPEFKPERVEALRKALPAFASVANPMDVTAGVFNSPDMFREALRLVANDPNVDMIGIALAAASGKLASTLAGEIAAVAKELDVPIQVAWNADEKTTAEAYRILDDAGVPRYGSPVRCARACGALWQLAHARMRLDEIERERPLVLEREATKRSLARRTGDLTEFEAKKVLTEYGIPVTDERLATNREQAAQFAKAIGFPVVMKIQSVDIPHKTEAGGVRLDVASAEGAAEAFDQIVASAKQHVPGASIDGVLIQEMVKGGIEVILGIKNDPLFGPALMFGLGGIFIEVLRDVVFRLSPITTSEAMEMIREIRAFKILDGARGQPKGDLDALAESIVRLSALAMDLKEQVAELDINPLFVLPAGQGVKAGDALIKLRAQSERAARIAAAG